MHAEHYGVPEEAARIDSGGAGGSLRPGRPWPGRSRRGPRPASEKGESELFIYPGYEWRRVDALLTNFHLPRSTLLAMVMSFGGMELVREAYRVAVQERYRFYSFGDAMLILNGGRAAVGAPVSIEVIARDGEARAGVLRTPHGAVETPTFMPVGTKGTVKGLTPGDLRSGWSGHRAGQYLPSLPEAWPGSRPGGRWAARVYGVGRADAHRLGWLPGVLAGQNAKHLGEGRRVRLRLRRLAARLHARAQDAKVQEELGADIAMVLDECPPADADREYHEESLRRTARWAARCKEAHGREDQALFGIVQGGSIPTCGRRAWRARWRSGSRDTRSAGSRSESRGSRCCETLAVTAPMLPADKPRYFMGIGDPVGILEVIGLGVDMFDCVLPTRLARHGRRADAGRPHQPQERRASQRPRAARPRVLVRDLHRVQPGLPGAPGAGERAARAPPHHPPQRPLHGRAVQAGTGEIWPAATRTWARAWISRYRRWPRPQAVVASREHWSLASRKL